MRKSSDKDQKELRRITGQFLHFLDQSKDRYSAFLEKLNASRNKNTTPQVATLVQKSIYRCFLYLGDLARYRATYYDTTSAKNYAVAEKYYRMALKQDPTQGNPHNQLAVLAQYLHRTCMAMYEYVRSIHIEVPFPTSQRNLDVLFDLVSADVKKKKLVDKSVVFTAPMSNAERQAMLRDFLTRFVHLSGILSQKEDCTDDQLEAANFILTQVDAQLPVLVRKWAIKRDLQLAMVVCAIHNLLAARANESSSKTQLAEKCLFTLVAIFAEMSVGQKTTSLDRPDLLLSVSTFCNWVRSDSSPEQQVKLSLDSTCAKRLWNALKNAWEHLCEFRVSRPTSVVLWEEMELSGFLPVSKDLSASNGPLCTSEDKDELAIVEAKMRSSVVCSFCDWLVNECGYDVLPFQPQIATPLASNEDSAAVSSAAMLLGDLDSSWTSNAFDQPVAGEKEEEVEEEEIIVLTPTSATSSRATGLAFAAPPATKLSAAPNGLDAPAQMLSAPPLPGDGFNMPFGDIISQPYGGAFPSAFAAPNTFSGTSQYFQSGSPSNGSNNLMPPSVFVEQQQQQQQQVHNVDVPSWPVKDMQFAKPMGNDELVSPADFLPYLPQPNPRTNTEESTRKSPPGF
eukprot:CAMPEP_0203758604 /NCGR_PEP_ID=MMETSP0098-20131031/11463_1 /ASSEMBLY_ACC=CAM_ASM_000208 /TAXON_ID=96639 /ORGANISM=" , Strain NY0313808BC1" /LENGTH=622 /DNA_ID=CAMNT_0050651135 /DNA_START=312 /DNA_END=2180 /DNA_ORIENTATION=+